MLPENTEKRCIIENFDVKNVLTITKKNIVLTILHICRRCGIQTKIKTTKLKTCVVLVLLGFWLVIFTLRAVPQKERNSQGWQCHEGKHKPVKLKQSK